MTIYQRRPGERREHVTADVMSRAAAAEVEEEEEALQWGLAAPQPEWSNP